MSLKLSVAAWTGNSSPKYPNQGAVAAHIGAPSLGRIRALLVIAEGIGKVANDELTGQISSQLTANTIHNNVQYLLEQKGPKRTTILCERLKAAIEAANEAVYNHWEDRQSGSMVTCVLAYDRLAIVANVGSCRVYHLHHRRLTQITEDHTLVTKLVQKGELSPEQARVHPQRFVFFNMLGMELNVQVDVFTQPLKIGDQLLLCNTNLHETLSEVELKQHLLGADNPNSAVESLAQEIQDAHTIGGVSIAVGKVEKDGSRTKSAR